MSSSEDEILFLGRRGGTRTVSSHPPAKDEARKEESYNHSIAKPTAHVTTKPRDRRPLQSKGREKHVPPDLTNRGGRSHNKPTSPNSSTSSGQNKTSAASIPMIGDRPGDDGSPRQVDIERTKPSTPRTPEIASVFADLDAHLSQPPLSTAMQAPAVTSPGNSEADDQAWKTIGQDWEHRSKPGIGWSRGRKQRGGRRKRPAYSLLTKEEEDEAIADYIRNTSQIDEDTPFALLAGRDIPGNDDDLLRGDAIGEAIQHAILTGKNIGSLDDSDDDGDDKSGSGSDDGIMDIIEVDMVSAANSASSNALSNTSLDTDEEEIRSILRQLQEDNDRSVAASLAWQEKAGHVGADDDNLDDLLAATLKQAAVQYRKSKPKKSRKHREPTFPSAGALADAVEQDPYNGFDIMDFNRPSLRRKKKGKGAKFDVTDTEEEQALEVLWEKDRQKKKQRKAERQELRAQGLLGPKGKSKWKGKSLNASEKMSMVQVRVQFQTFLGCEDDYVALPPMDKQQRKLIHYIADKFGVKSSSSGSGSNRFVRLAKTTRTVEFDGDTFTRLERRAQWAFTENAAKFSGNKSGRNFKGKTKLHGWSTGGGGSGGGNAAFSYRTGEVVGGAAPELSVENRGRGLLEKMGWSAGMALGATDNKGILEPISQVMRNSRAGLG